MVSIHKFVPVHIAFYLFVFRFICRACDFEPAERGNIDLPSHFSTLSFFLTRKNHE